MLWLCLDVETLTSLGTFINQFFSRFQIFFLKIQSFDHFFMVSDLTYIKVNKE